ncbi:response regulator transcription factor [uncultured Sulfitobacter sp.]|uniref:response regulator transcription factor n=1 Tax=uncultured Sulfitobacter sp. TaxID=191468 RepID=UPI00262CB1A1|nr:response regulator transcription factor [uncultured Sulfitobacter sp.]
MRITLVEDNISLAKGITYRLEDAGHAVDALHDGAQAQEFLRDDGADLVILDINLPGIDGLTLLTEMRRRGDARPVILLTARAQTDDRVQGLDAGADDYLIKPFEMAELEARVRALLRRRTVPQQQFRSIGALQYDASARQLFANDTELALPRREVSVFEVLLLADGRVVSKHGVLDHVYGTGADIEETVVEVYVSRLRSRLRPHGVTIRTRRGLGYQMIADRAE